MGTEVSSVEITLRGVRLSFPELWKPKAVKQGDEPRYSASFLLDKEKDAEQIKALREAVKKVAGEKWGAKLPKGVKFCVHEGNEKEYEGYDDSNIFVTAASKRRPSVVDEDLSPVNEDDGKIYAGCYVNAVLRLWTQDNNFGKRVNAELRGVQFDDDGEAFGAAPFKPEDHFKAKNGNGGRKQEAPAGGDPDDIPF